MRFAMHYGQGLDHDQKHHQLQGDDAQRDHDFRNRRKIAVTGARVEGEKEGVETIQGAGQQHAHGRNQQVFHHQFHYWYIIDKNMLHRVFSYDDQLQFGVYDRIV